MEGKRAKRGAAPVRTEARRPRSAPLAAYEGLAAFVRAQLEAWRASEPGLRAGGDAESVHDARVALRRLRATIGELRGVLGRAEREHLCAELGWLARRLGRARDLDVLRAELRRARPRASVAPLLARVEAEREAQQARILRTLAAARTRKLLARLEARFGGPAGERRPGREARAPFARVLARRLGRRLRRVQVRAARLGADSRADELHRLRIGAKKLRYLLECARGLAPREEMGRALRLLKDLQAALGAIQDAEVQGAFLREREPAGAGPGVQALAGFEARLAARRSAARAGLPARAAAFLAPAGRAAFEACLAALAARDG